MDRLLLRPGRLRSLHSAIRQRTAWGAVSCRCIAPFIPLRVRGYSSTTTALETRSEPALVKGGLSQKPYYVTTPIFYVNAAPHIGHMYSMLLADVLKRWFKLNGQQSLLLTGTDEHGMKIQQVAAAHDTPPKEWCDLQSDKFKRLAAKADLANDFFMRTTDEDHKDAVRHFWFLLQEKGLIYEKKHEGWYCVSDETFYPESMLTRKIDATTGKVSMASTETGNTVEWTEEKNYHFRLTALKPQLLEFYKQNPQWIVPRHQMKEVVTWVENSLDDLSISRPSSRLDWGIRVPNDSSQTIYVWVDALINYITKAGFPTWQPGKETEGGWPADVHVIGKDIVRFHGVYWPALLMAVDIPPPKKLLSHAHWLMSGHKMSKSRGNVVNPFHAVDRWGVDTMRFFMIHDGGVEDDSNYENAIIAERYKCILQDTLGNLVSRVVRTKSWNVQECVQKSADTNAAAALSGQSEFMSQEALIAGLYEHTHNLMQNPDPRRALIYLVEAAYATNKFISELEPWKAASWIQKSTAQESPGEETKRKLDDQRALLVRTIYITADSIRVMGILLQPFMPGKGAEILDLLGVSTDKRTFEYAALGKDFSYGKPLIDIGRAVYDGLFPQLDVEE